MNGLPNPLAFQEVSPLTFPTVTGAGAVAYSAKNTVARVTTPGGSPAYFNRRILLLPGEEIVAYVEGKCHSGEAKFGFDVLIGPNKGNGRTNRRILPGDWQQFAPIRYKASLYTAEVLFFYCGVGTAPAGDFEMRMPQLYVQSQRIGQPRQICHGMLQIVGTGSGPPALSWQSDQPCWGIKGIEQITAASFDIELSLPLGDILNEAGGNDVDDLRAMKPWFRIDNIGAAGRYLPAKWHNNIDSDVEPRRNKFTMVTINPATQTGYDWNAFSGTEFYQIDGFIA